MAMSILSCLRIFTLVMFVLEPNRVLSSRHFGFISYGDNGAGMCASTVAPRGYKCQEFEVYIFNLFQLYMSTSLES